MKNFIIGSPGLQTRSFPPSNLSEPWHDELTLKSPPPPNATDLPAPPDALKLSDQISPPRSPAPDSRSEKPLYARVSTRINAPLSAEPARRKTPIGSVAPHDRSERQRQDRASIPFSPIPLAPAAATAVPLFQECPRIDLVALVREKHKARKLQKQKLSVALLQKEKYRRVIPRDSSSEKFR